MAKSRSDASALLRISLVFACCVHAQGMRSVTGSAHRSMTLLDTPNPTNSPTFSPPTDSPTPMPTHSFGIYMYMEAQPQLGASKKVSSLTQMNSKMTIEQILRTFSFKTNLPPWVRHVEQLGYGVGYTLVGRISGAKFVNQSMTLEEYGINDEYDFIVKPMSTHGDVADGLHGGVWNGNTCPDGLFRWAGSLSKQPGSYYGTGLHSHHCMVGIIPLHNSLRGKRRNDVVALALTAKHCICDGVDGAYQYNDFTSFSASMRVGQYTVSFGGKQISYLTGHFRVLGATIARSRESYRGSSVSDNDFAVLYLGDFAGSGYRDLWDNQPIVAIGGAEEQPERRRRPCSSLTTKHTCRAEEFCHWKSEFFSFITGRGTCEERRQARLRRPMLLAGGWGLATPHHNKQEAIAASNYMRDPMQCVDIDASGKSGPFRKKKWFWGVATQVGGRARGISRGDSGTNVVFAEAPNEIAGVLALAEAPNFPGRPYGQYNGWTSLVQPSKEVLQAICYSFETYAWPVGNTVHHVGGESLWTACQHRRPSNADDVILVGPTTATSGGPAYSSFQGRTGLGLGMYSGLRRDHRDHVLWAQPREHNWAQPARTVARPFRTGIDQFGEVHVWHYR